MSTKTMSHLSFHEMPRVLRPTRRWYFVCRCDKHRFRILKRGGRSSRRAQTEEERVAGAKRSETAEKFPVTVHHEAQRLAKTKVGLLPFKPKNNYQCMKLPGCGCAVSAEEQVVCRSASQEHHDWRTRGARLTPLVWLTHGAPVPCHLAEL